MDYITRSIEPVVLGAAQAFKALLLTGSRQVGKSTLLGHLFSDYSYVTFDDPLMLAQAKTEPGLFMADNRPPLLIDEIQYAPDLLPYIKMACDSSDARGQYLLAGSQQFNLMKDVSESLAGRIGILELSPLSLREIQGVDYNMHFVPTGRYIQEREEQARFSEDIWTVIHRGGYPQMRNDGMDWSQFYSSYVRTYLERDVNQLAMVKDQMKFTQFLTVLAARTAQLLNYQNIANELEISLGTVKSWVSIMEATGLVFILQPFTNSALNRAIRTPKLYFRDTGLACYLTRWSSPEVARSGAMAGSLFETFVVSEILKSFANEGLDYRMHVTWYRGKDRLRRKNNGEASSIEAEIDLIIEENGLYHPIEIKMTANPKQGMATAFDVLDKVGTGARGEGAIICMYDKPLTLREGVRAIPVSYI
ncbi:MAG: ATP-binding protein [Coriobacteriia bacterium]|nr:ATP-binding protein [Coriobacteriia bacterium]